MSSVKSNAATTFVIAIFLLCCGMSLFYWQEDAFQLVFYDYHLIASVLGISLIRTLLPIVCYWASFVGGIVEAVAEDVEGIDVVLSFRVAIAFSVYLVVLGKINYDELVSGVLFGIGSCIGSLWLLVILLRRAKKAKKKAANKIDYYVVIACNVMIGVLFLTNVISMIVMYVQDEAVRRIF